MSTPTAVAPAPTEPAAAESTLAGPTLAELTADVPAVSAPALMDTRVFRGRTVDELIPQIEAELGADAIVVRRERGLEGGIAGFFQRPYVEVEARRGAPRLDRYDEDAPQPALPSAPSSGAPQPARPRPVGAYVTGTLASFASAASEPQQPTAPTPDVEVEVEEFRELMPERLADTFADALVTAERSATQALPASLTQVGSELASEPRPETELRARTIETRPHVRTVETRPRARASIAASLAALGVSDQLAHELIETAYAHVLPLAPRLSLVRAVHSALVQWIPSAAPLPSASAALALAGPGGAGKTSCCAALLSAYRKGSTLAASCATIMLDDERAEPTMLLSPHVMAPTAVASRTARQALADARADGLLLLDLPPLSPADRPAIRTVASLLGELQPERTIVALPATLGATAAAQLLSALRPLAPTALAITHADETDQLGVAVEAACRFGLAPEYLLDRSRARAALTRIDPTYLADRLLAR